MIPSLIPGHVGFNEYTDVSLYVGDLFLLLAFLIFIINNKKYIMSIFNINLFHVEQIYLLIPFLISIYAYLSVFWSDQRLLAFYSASIFVQGPVVFYYLLGIFSVESNNKCSTWNIFRYICLIFIISAIFQSIIGIIQFLHQSSLGIAILNESFLSTAIPGVAETLIGSIPLMRSYGTFLHPNIFAGYIFFSLMLFLIAKRIKLFHVEHSTFIVLVSLLTVAIVLSISKSTILGFIIGIIVVNLYLKCNICNFVPRGTISNKNNQLFHVEQLILMILFSAVILGYYALDSGTIQKSFSERFDLIYSSQSVFQQISLPGIGIGQFVFTLSHFQSLDWMLQPIHNVYVLLVLELGVVGFIFFGYFLYKLFINVPRGTISIHLFGIFSGFLLISLFDHYFWDIRVGQNLLWILLGLMYSSRYLTNNNNVS